MKKKLLILVLVVLSLGIYGCSKNEDALKFKDEYESLNGTTNSSGKEIREIDIPKDNPFIYKTAEEVVKAIENEETFVVYFGFPSCPWCRSVLPTLIDEAQNFQQDAIYYVDVENIRDVISYDDKTKTYKTTKEGDKDYMKLIELLAPVLADYTVQDSAGNKISTEEKRIFAPNIVAVKDGEAIALESGISALQEDPYMELSAEIEDDMESKFTKFFEKIDDSSLCTPEGC